MKGDAEYKKAQNYDIGDGVEQNDDEAVKWYKKAVALGHAGAMNDLGSCYAIGQGVEQDYQEALRLYRLAAEKGDGTAMSNVGDFYENGLCDVVKDYEEAVRWYRMSVEKGNQHGQRNLARCYQYSIGVDQNYEEAVRLYRLSSEQGDAEAKQKLGALYLEGGHGLDQNEEEAVRLLREAVDLGNVDAYISLGCCYDKGEGVEKNFGEAFRLFQFAAEKGNAAAISNVGECYEYGNGVEKDYEEAVRFYRLSAEKGHQFGQYNLARCYENGTGVDQNYEEAARFYRLSASQQYSEAQRNLGRLFEKGHGVEQNFEEALTWFKLAAEQGDAEAQVSVGFYYKIGQCVEQNDKEATRWFRLAAEQEKSKTDKKLKKVDTKTMHGPGGIETLLNVFRQLRGSFNTNSFEKMIDWAVFREWGKDPALETFLAQESILDDLISKVSKSAFNDEDNRDALIELVKQRNEAARSCLESAKQLLARYEVAKPEFEDFSRLRSQVVVNLNESYPSCSLLSQKVDHELYLKRRQDVVTEIKAFMDRFQEARAVTDKEAKKSGELLDQWSKSVNCILFNDASQNQNAYSKLQDDFQSAVVSFRQALVAEYDFTAVKRFILMNFIHVVNELSKALFDEHHKAHLRAFVDSVDRAQRRIPELEARSVGPPSLEQLKECRMQEKGARKRYLVAKVELESDSEDDDAPSSPARKKKKLTNTLTNWRKAAHELESVATNLSFQAASFFPELVQESKIIRDQIESGINTTRTRDHYEKLAQLPGRHHVTKVSIDDRICVLKAYPLTNEHSHQAFRKEVKYLSQLRHPHVVELTAAFIENDTGYVEMPFYEYGDLWQWKKTVEPDAKLLQLVFRSALLGLSFVHSMDVIHSDIKPVNIFVDSSHCAKLGDFDVSKDDSERVRDLMTTAVVPTAVGFTASYVAPELLSGGSSAKPSKPSDVYAFGLCLFDVLFSDAPGESKRPSASEVAHGRKDICFPDDAGEELKKTLTALLNKDPKKRPSCSDALAQLSYFSLQKESSSDFLVQNCMICDKGTVNGIECASDQHHHFQCDECLARYFTAFSSADDGVQLLVPDGSGVKCPFPTNEEHDCKPYDDAQLARLLPADVFQQSMKVRARHMEQRLSVEYDVRLQQELREREAQGAVDRHRQYIIERILNLACPRCSAAFFEFTGCFAVTCARCRCGFCAWCFQDCGNDAHAHVPGCRLGNRGLYGTKEQFDESNRVRRQQKVRAYLADILDQDLRKQVKQACKKEFKDLKLKI